MAGLRRRLAEMLEDQKRLTSERDARMQGPPLAAIVLRPRHLGALSGRTIKALAVAAIAFDTTATAAAPDPDVLEAAACDLIEAAQQARTAGAAVRELDRQEVVHLADLLQEIVAEQLARWPGPLATKAAALRRARLHTVIDAMALAVLRLLPAPPAG
jgi:hypothetical protein